MNTSHPHLGRKRSVLTAAALTLGGLAVGIAPALAASATLTPHRVGVSATTSFTTPSLCSADNVWTVPAGVTSVQIRAVGGHGGNALQYFSEGNGGRGAQYRATYSVVPGQKLYLQVGANGAADAAKATLGGGGVGGTSVSVNQQKYPMFAGSGGGFSGVATDPECTHWLMVAGGGGGGGAAEYMGSASQIARGGTGGDAWAGGNPAGPGSSVQSNCAGQPGGMAPHAVGGAPSSTNPGNDTGAAPVGMTGGKGGSSHQTFQGSLITQAGGGGGGGGYRGGAGGGYAAWTPQGENPTGYTRCAGGGGAGGTSYLDPSATGVTSWAEDGTPRVDFTPVTGAEPTIYLTSSDNGLVLNIPGADTTSGTHLIEWPRDGNWNAQWVLHQNGSTYQIVNPHSNSCVTTTGDRLASDSVYAAITPCDATSAAQQWNITTESNGTLLITNPDGKVLSISGSAWGASVDVADQGTGTANHWMATSAAWG